MRIWFQILVPCIAWVSNFLTSEWSPRYHFVSHADKSVTEWARNLAKGAGSQGRILSTMYWPACLSSCPSQTVSLKLSLCLALVSIIDGAIEVLSKKFIQQILIDSKCWDPFLLNCIYLQCLFWCNILISIWDEILNIQNGWCVQNIKLMQNLSYYFVHICIALKWNIISTDRWRHIC